MSANMDNFKFKLDEIDKKIEGLTNSNEYKAYQICIDRQKANNSIFFGGGFAGGLPVTVNGIVYSCVESRFNDILTKIKNLGIERAALVIEMGKETQFLQNQELLQQQAVTAQANALATQAEIRIKEAEALVAQAQFKSEQEKQIAAQQLQKAEQELQKAKLAADLAAAGGKGNLESSRILMGGSIAKDYKTPLIITGVVLGATAIGFILYKILK